jgi:LSD1 subclass zinc finger protein
MLCAALRVRGSGAPKIDRGRASKTARRLIPLILLATLGALALTAVPALAAAPETPETGKASAVTATTATLEDGVLNPHAALGELAEYEYRFRVSETECEGESSTAGMALGEKEEKLPAVDLIDLQPDAHYTFCLFERSLATGETSPASPPEHFATNAAPPTVTSASASVASTEATLAAQINPNNQTTSYVFEYSKTEAAGKLTGTIVKVDGASPLENFGEQTASIATGATLTPGTTYYYRVVAENAQSKTEGKPVAFPAGSLQSFTTLPTPATEAPSPLGASTATFKGKLTPLNATTKTEYSFDYNVGTECTGGGVTNPESAGTGSGAKAVTTAVTGLQPNQTYSVCLVSANAFGSEIGTPSVSFKTLVAPATVDSESVANIKSSEVTFNGAVNPNNQLTECHFQYGAATVSENEVACSPEQLKGYGEQSVSPTKTEVVNAGLVTVPAPVAGLAPGTEYRYRIVTKNGKGEEGLGPEQSFRTAEEPEKQPVSSVAATTATLNGVLDPHNSFEAGKYEFLYKQSEGECTGGAVTPAESSTTASPQPVSAKVGDLQPGAAYTFCLLVRNGAGEEAAISSPETFTTLAAVPTIAGTFTSGVESTVATLNAQVDPDGEATTYRFEYGTTASYGASTPETALTGGLTSSEAATASVAGLTPGTMYHYRVVATNSLSPAGGTPGPDTTFTVPSAPGAEPAQECPNEKLREEQPYGLTLSECRAYEMVSPADTYGQDATREGAPARASEAKEAEPALAYRSQGSFGQPKGALLESEYVARRTASGWVNQAVTALATPYQGNEEIRYDYPGELFTPELTAGLVLSTAKLTENAEPVHQLSGYGVYRFSFEPEVFEWVGSEEINLASPWGASEDLDRVVRSVSGFGNVGSAVIESARGSTIPVAVNNSAEVLAGQVGTSSGIPDQRSKDAWHAVSQDGTRVDFTSEGQLYARVNIGELQSPLASPEADGTGTLDEGSDNVTALMETSGTFAVGQEIKGNGLAPGTMIAAVTPGALTLSRPAAASGTAVALVAGGGCTVATDACTIDVSASQRFLHANRAGTQPARFWGASTNGERIFFTSDAELTEDAYTGSTSYAPNLYEYDLGTAKLTDLSVVAAGEGAAVQGVVQISEDGSYVYFVADGALAEGATAGQPNLYVSHEARPPTFIATLAGKDITDWSEALASPEETASGPATNSAVVSPDGASLAFISEQPLTGYDNEQANVGDCETGAETGKCREVYLYDAGTRSLRCASCNTSGLRPVGPAKLPGTSGSAVAEPQTSYRPRNLLADGSLFFDSRDALTGGPPTGRQVVYEYKGGGLHAISPAGVKYDAFFLDATPDGSNVFFGSTAPLTAEDSGSNVIVWDARVDGGFQSASSLPCTTGEACRPLAASSSGGGAPASATFSGPGNPVPPGVAPVEPQAKPKPQTRAQKLAAALKLCRKDKKRSTRAACEKQARHKYGTGKQVKKASIERRVKS